MRFGPSFWRKCRVTFRWCRITAWLAVLVLLCAAVWLNRVGLPDFLKDRLVRAAHERGIELQFTRMRLRFVRGLVADNVRIGTTNVAGHPTLSLAEVQLRLDHAALWHRQLQLTALILRDGKFTVPVQPATGPPRRLEIDNLNARLQFDTNDTWTLDHFTATFIGTQISVSSRIAHASELPNLGIYQPKNTGATGVLQAELNQLADTLDKIHFTGSPQISLILTGDARDLHSFSLRLGARVPDAESPWGVIENGSLAADVDHPSTNALPQLTLSLSAGTAITRWGDLNGASLSLQTQVAPPDQIPPAVLQVSAAAVGSRWGHAKNLRLDAHLAAAQNLPGEFNPSLAWWTNAQPYQLAWSLELAQLKTEQVDADSIAAGGVWLAPELAVTSLSVTLGGGHLNAGAKLNVETRWLTFTNQSDFDLHTLDALLTEKTRARISEFVWRHPPFLQGAGALQLPPWTDPQPDWRALVQPTIQLAGEFAFTNATILGCSIDAARAHFTYTNLVWNVTGMKFVEANTRLELAGDEDDRTKEFQWHVQGQIDPAAADPFLKSDRARRGFNIVSFTEPVALDLHARGRLYDLDSLSVEGRVAATNFMVRAQPVDSVAASLFYTNRILEFFNPVLWRARSSQTMTADRVTLDFNRKLICFTNGFSTAEPQVVGNAIGPKTAKIMSPYQFLTPPTVRVNGQVPLRNVNNGRDVATADITFQIIQGAPFRWLKLQATNVTGSIHWQGQSLYLTNVVAQLYGGRGTGSADFDFRPVEHDCDYDFSFVLQDVNLRLLAEKASLRTNHLEGMLNATVVVTNASSADWHSWNGGGQASLRDGLLWDVPLFGILSPALNSVSPGLGSSRATEAAGKFVITNGVVYTDSLSIGLSLSRLQYVGTVDLKQNVDARVTAQPLRNAPVIGSVVSTLLWPVGKLFEYHVTGTLQNPKTTPVYAPTKVLMFPLHPIRSLEELFPSSDSNYFTNAPAQK